jgi:hypothetical protein
MAESQNYRGIIVPDAAIGMSNLRHFLVEPPVDPKDIHTIELATNANHLSSEDGWSKFTIGTTNYASDDAIFNQAKSAFEEAGHTLEPHDELSDSPTMQDYLSLISRRKMRFDGWDPNYAPKAEG